MSDLKPCTSVCASHFMCYDYDYIYIYPASEEQLRYVGGDGKHMGKAVALQGAFGVGRNGDANTARHRVCFWRGFSSTSWRDLGAGKWNWGRSLAKGGWGTGRGLEQEVWVPASPRAGGTELLDLSRAGVGMLGKEGLWNHTGVWPPAGHLCLIQSSSVEFKRIYT